MLRRRWRLRRTIWRAPKPSTPSPCSWESALDMFPASDPDSPDIPGHIGSAIMPAQQGGGPSQEEICTRAPWRSCAQEAAYDLPHGEGHRRHVQSLRATLTSSPPPASRLRRFTRRTVVSIMASAAQPVGSFPIQARRRRPADETRRSGVVRQKAVCTSERHL